VQRPERGEAYVERRAAGQKLLQRGLRRSIAALAQQSLAMRRCQTLGCSSSFTSSVELSLARFMFGSGREGTGLPFSPPYRPRARCGKLAIHAFGVGIGVLVARIFVIPIHDPDGAVGTGLGAHGHEPAVVGADEILDELALKLEPFGVRRSW